MRAVRMFLSPKWLLGHAVVLALSVTMILLGRWQLDVSDGKGFALQNFGYTLQWWAFTAFGIFMWCRVMRDRWRRACGEEPENAFSGGELVRRPTNATTGPALLATRPSTPDTAPVLYRGYVLPNSADPDARPVPSHGDAYHDAYNDHLWRLSLGDAAEER